MAKKYLWYDGSGRIELELSKAQALQVSHSGDCELDCKKVYVKVAGQLAAYTNTCKASVLNEYGAWDEKELKDETANNLRLIWIAGNDIAEEQSFR